MHAGLVLTNLTRLQEMQLSLIARVLSVIPAQTECRVSPVLLESTSQLQGAKIVVCARQANIQPTPEQTLLTNVSYVMQGSIRIVLEQTLFKPAWCVVQAHTRRPLVSLPAYCALRSRTRQVQAYRLQPVVATQVAQETPSRIAKYAKQAVTKRKQALPCVCYVQRAARPYQEAHNSWIVFAVLDSADTRACVTPALLVSGNQQTARSHASSVQRVAHHCQEATL